MRWYEDVFKSDAWFRIHQTFWEVRDAAADALFVEELLQLAPASTVLDVPSGTGRLSVALAERGHRVEGVDLSPRLLAEARSFLEESSSHLDGVSFRHADMRDLPDDGRYDGAVCWWGSFGYLGDEGDAAFARSVAQSLRPGGRFLIDTFLAEGLLPVFQNTGVRRVGEVWIAEERAYDADSGMLTTEWTVNAPSVTGESYAKFMTPIRLYGWREIRNLLLGAGFSEVQHLDGEGKPFAFSSRGARSRIVARR